MISYIRGELAAVQEQKAIVEAGGIGYGIYMSQQTLSMLPAFGPIPLTPINSLKT